MPREAAVAGTRECLSWLITGSGWPSASDGSAWCRRRGQEMLTNRLVACRCFVSNSWRSKYPSHQDTNVELLLRPRDCLIPVFIFCFLPDVYLQNAAHLLLCRSTFPFILIVPGIFSTYHQWPPASRFALHFPQPLSFPILYPLATAEDKDFYMRKFRCIEWREFPTLYYYESVTKAPLSYS